MGAEIPDKTYFKIGEAAKLVGVEPHTLRYWEKEFRAIRPSKTKSRQRLFRKKDIQLLLVIRHLLHEKRFTIDGARQKLKELNGAGMDPERVLDAIDSGRPIDPDVQDEAEQRAELAARVAQLQRTLAERDAEIASLRASDAESLRLQLQQAAVTEVALRDTVDALRSEVERLRARASDAESSVANGELRDEMRRRWTAVIADIAPRRRSS